MIEYRGLGIEGEPRDRFNDWPGSVSFRSLGRIAFFLVVEDQDPIL